MEIPHNRSVIYLLLSLIFLSSCVGGPKSSTKSKAPEPAPTDITSKVGSQELLISGTPASIAYEGRSYIFTPTTISSGVIVSGLNIPSWLSLNGTTGVLSGTASGSVTTDNLRVFAIKGSSYSELGPFSLRVFGDPLYPYQWHLVNTGQSAFASNPAGSGNDLNMKSTIDEGIIGTGSSILVSDDGLEITHPDIDANLFTNYHKNYDALSPFYGDPRGRSNSGSHGTSVAGIIAAEAWNDIGVRGIAPGSVIAGNNYIGSDQSTEMELDQASGNYSIFNYSYGFNFTNFNLLWDQDYADQVNSGFSTGRLGKGSLYVKAAGNSYEECDYFSSSYYLIEDIGLCFPHNANVDRSNAISNMVIVGALNGNGQKASYSSTGSSLWISAFGGEYGQTDPAIVTLDQQSCDRGYSRDNVSSSNSAFQKGTDSLNADCDYTHTFNGTSSATPMISAAIALILEANSNLTARDVKYILAKTARVVNDPSFTTGHPQSQGGFFDLAGHSYEQDWITNAAGFNFHNHFGFGLVDIDAAITLAKSYSSGWGTQLQTNPQFDQSGYMVAPNVSIPDSSASGVSSSIFISDFTTIEGVQVMVNVTHGRPGDLGIELTSPTGTKSILLNVNNSFLIPFDSSDSPVWVADLDEFVMSSNAFYGESARGVWTLKVIDGLGGATDTEFDDAASQTGNLVDWRINILGH